ncbi:hypothetical protein [Bacillus toyonensis]|uniref:hypothetical protein n=1 Tax=Bacillus toyonensis TaxID=155322 RepID=UPI000BEE6C7A|nr:hypothetical protein [Bacillus toyonensis]PEB14895.1 hypothetical protein COO08_30880 [Bacillus toyonensis]PFY12884.1 hypothetical protein COL47_26390 [Bacillus toyonensis]PHA07882.1 hypothetical protein COE66_23850 [Bacillus toyonensis]UKS63321.1 hypothetical protein K6T24_29270 [Bacillus toyonensis]
MILVSSLSTEEDIKRLINSKEITVYVISFYQDSENETPHVVLINEKHEPFSVTNDPYDHLFWGEIDRISICYDEDYCEKSLLYYSEEKNDWRYKDVKYIRFTEIHNPKLSIFREKYQAFSVKDKRKEQIQTDFALLLEGENKNVLIHCSKLGANLYVIDDIKKVKEVLVNSAKVI